jgi:hypothetical protein
VSNVRWESPYRCFSRAPAADNASAGPVFRTPPASPARIAGDGADTWNSDFRVLCW